MSPVAKYHLALSTAFRFSDNSYGVALFYIGIRKDHHTDYSELVRGILWDLKSYGITISHHHRDKNIEIIMEI